MTPHLGSWISALADGQLEPEEAEQALAHVTVCRACARELDDARRSRRLLSDASADLRPDPALTARLIALQASIPDTQDDPLRSPRRVPGFGTGHGPDPRRGTGFDGWDTTPLPGLVDSVRLSGNIPMSGRRRAARLLAVGAGGAGVLGLALFVLGQGPQVNPEVSAADDLTLLARTGPDERAAGQDVLAQLAPAGAIAEQRSAAALDWASTQGWVVPAHLPDGVEVTAVRMVGKDAEILEIDLAGAAGHVVVREQVGTLGNRDAVHELGSTPAHVMWQSEGVVIDVVADLPRDMLDEFVGSFPADDGDAGVLSRISRGWSAATGAISNS